MKSFFKPALCAIILATFAIAPAAQSADTIPQDIMAGSDPAPVWKVQSPHATLSPATVNRARYQQLEAMRKTLNERSVRESDESSVMAAEALRTALQRNEALHQQLIRQQSARQTPVPESDNDKLSYANGVAFARQIVQSLRAQQQLGIEPDRTMVLAGIQDTFSQRVALNAGEIDTLVTRLDGELNNKLAEQQKARQKIIDTQKIIGRALIEKTKKRKGVKQIGGAYYVVTKNGKGAALKADGTAELLIIGRLADGTVFDNSGLEKKWQRVKLNTLLPAMTRILSRVSQGSEIDIVLPPEEAFGEAGVDSLIPAGATIAFKVTVN